MSEKSELFTAEHFRPVTGTVLDEVMVHTLVNLTNARLRPILEERDRLRDACEYAKNAIRELNDAWEERAASLRTELTEYRKAIDNLIRAYNGTGMPIHFAVAEARAALEKFSTKDRP
jgi:hypothetical protein